MSAIGGIVHFGEKRLDKRELQRMANSLGLVESVESRLQKQLHAGFIARICCFSPEDRFDRQPVLMAQREVLLFHGLLANREEVIGVLGLSGREARVAADSELVALIWKQWGEETPRKLVGSYTLVHWSSQRKKLFICSGAPFGKPLFMYHDSVSGSVYFASNPQALFTLPCIPKDLDETALADLLLRNNLAKETSLFKGITVLPPAHCITFTPKGKKCFCYWMPDPDKRLRFSSEAEGWEAFNELFETVVGSYLRTDGPLGIQMSGGHDSGALAAQAAKILAKTDQSLFGYTRVPSIQTPLIADTATAYSCERDRVEMIRAMHPNIIPHYIETESVPVLDGLSQQFNNGYNVNVCSATFITGYQALYTQARADGVKVMMMGTGGNETFSYNGYPRLRQLWRSGRWYKLAKEVTLLHQRRYISKGVLKQELIQAFLPKRMNAYIQSRHSGQNLWSYYSSIHPQFAHETRANERLDKSDNMMVDYINQSDWQRRSWFFVANPARHLISLPETFGLDLREPIADRRLVEFCLALPESFFLDGGVSRRLVRLGMAHLLPEAIRLSPARGRQDVDWAYRVKRDSTAITQALQEAREHPDISRYLDVERMQTLWDSFESVDFTRPDKLHCVPLYKQALFGSLNVARFVQWFEGGNH
ncbi:MAG: asparagine synthase-related protein [Pseudomonadales bacterium]|nr:asparagine synthase-related protein [Pseudomonadales bacterium]